MAAKDTHQPNPDERHRYSSVSELFARTSTSKTQTEKFEEQLHATRLVRTLIACRAEAGLTQKELAERMECTQSRISKLENSIDVQLTVEDIASYLNATGNNLALHFGQAPTLVERVKSHAMALKTDLEELAGIASENGDNKEICEGIEKFFGEAFYNFFLIICDAAGKLPTVATGSQPADISGLSIRSNVKPLPTRNKVEPVG